MYASDPALRRAVERGGAELAGRRARAPGRGVRGGGDPARRRDANHLEPELHTLSPTGERIDAVRFHPAWHTMMRIARRNGIANLPLFDDRPSAWSAYGASLYMHCQIESGSTCPTTMTKASIPVMRLNAPLYAATGPLLASLEHDARDVPLQQQEPSGRGREALFDFLRLASLKRGRPLRSALTSRYSHRLWWLPQH